MQQNNEKITAEALALLGDHYDSPVRRVLHDVVGSGGTINKRDVLRVFTVWRYMQEWEQFKSYVLSGNTVDAAFSTFLDGVRYGRMMGVDASTIATKDWIAFLDHLHGDDEEWWVIDPDDDDEGELFP